MRFSEQKAFSSRTSRLGQTEQKQFLPSESKKKEKVQKINVKRKQLTSATKEMERNKMVQRMSSNNQIEGQDRSSGEKSARVKFIVIAPYKMNLFFFFLSLVYTLLSIFVFSNQTING